MAGVPEAIGRLVEQFGRNLEAYRGGHYNETQLRREFVDPLFAALGWDVANKAGYAQAYKDVIHEDAIKVGGVTKAPDYCFRIGGARKFFVEAKKPSVDIARQKEVDASIATKADIEYLYDKPYEDNKKDRVDGQFTAGRLSPHRVLGVEENGELIDPKQLGGDASGGEDGQILVNIKGVDAFQPSNGEVRSDGGKGIACWFIDTDFNGQTLLVRQAYFLGANDPYESSETSHKAQINAEGRETLPSDTPRPFDKPKGGRVGVNAINHLGDEVVEMLRVDP